MGISEELRVQLRQLDPVSRLQDATEELERVLFHAVSEIRDLQKALDVLRQNSSETIDRLRKDLYSHKHRKAGIGGLGR